MDSNSTLSLALWIEEQAGSEVDLSEVDFIEAWDTPQQIVAFIEEHFS